MLARRCRLLAPLLLLPLLAACSPAEGEVLFVRHAGADMPVWVRGNTDSGVFVLWLHGGPGDNALHNVGTPFFAGLEERYAVVYWDQRASGSSQGAPAPSTLSLAQFVEDTDLVVDLVRARYAPRTLVMAGHSWGGTLGPAYLGEPARQAKVDAWVEVDGSHDVQRGYALSRDIMLRHAAERLAAGEQPEVWEAARRFYEERPVLVNADLPRHSGYVYRAGGYVYDRTGLRGDPLAELLSPMDPMSSRFTPALLPRFFDLASMDMTEQLRRITLPSLVLWGRHDYILPVGLAAHAYEALGTPASAKRLVVIEEAAHSPHAEQPEASLAAVADFIESVRAAR
jgi:pimeloyl-ACP methyl ester carboxylesterase